MPVHPVDAHIQEGGRLLGIQKLFFLLCCLLRFSGSASKDQSGCQSGLKSCHLCKRRRNMFIRYESRIRQNEFIAVHFLTS